MLKYLLLPFSLIYGAVLSLRHFLYDTGILRSIGFDIPVIVVGNLSVGGTGKSPMTMYLANLLKQFHPALLSRGYGRSTKGFMEVNAEFNYTRVGDEPLMFKFLYPELDVFVCEDRPKGIEEISKLNRTNGLVLLDDAFQHRGLKPGFSILLFDYKSLVDGDYLLPAGRRRDLWNRRHAADVIVITRSPQKADNDLRKLFSGKQVFFSRYAKTLYRNIEGTWMQPEDLNGKKIYLLTGIASPEGLINYYNKIGSKVMHDRFPDHHSFTEKDVNKIKENMVMFAGSDTRYITTTKDFMRLKDLLEPDLLRQWFFAEPVVEIDDEQEFKKTILNYVSTGNRNSSLHS